MEASTAAISRRWSGGIDFPVPRSRPLIVGITVQSSFFTPLEYPGCCGCNWFRWIFLLSTTRWSLWDGGILDAGRRAWDFRSARICQFNVWGFNAVNVRGIKYCFAVLGPFTLVRVSYSYRNKETNEATDATDPSLNWYVCGDHYSWMEEALPVQHWTGQGSIDSFWCCC